VALPLEPPFFVIDAVAAICPRQEQSAAFPPPAFELSERVSFFLLLRVGFGPVPGRGWEYFAGASVLFTWGHRYGNSAVVDWGESLRSQDRATRQARATCGAYPFSDRTFYRGRHLRPNSPVDEARRLGRRSILQPVRSCHYGATGSCHGHRRVALPTRRAETEGHPTFTTWYLRASRRR